MLIDSHCHLDFPELKGELDAELARAQAAGVGLMVTICTKVRCFAEVRAIAEAHGNVFCSVGTHPHNAAEEPDITVEELVELSRHKKVVAIGEAGLDYHYDYSPRDIQKKCFRTHIAAARETGLPLVIHAREADADIARILEQETKKGAFPFVLHCFTSSADLARRGLALGGYISFSGVLTFKKSDALRDIAMAVPYDRLLVETDAPYLAPEPFRGKTNEPAFVVHTASCLAAMRGVSEAEMARTTTENFFHLFKKVPRSAAKAPLSAA
jgi:TatD DNase family protein